MPVKFVITTLKTGVDPQDYERWVRERDYAYTNRNPNFISYRVHRISEIAGAPPPGWRYIERIEVRNLDQHQKDLASPEGAALLDELYGRFLDRSKNIYLTTELVE
jgi:REDY-like protein HapK